MTFPQRPLPGLGEASSELASRARSGAVVPVSLLVGSARLLLERQLGLMWVSGEISNFTRAASGHCYFNLKDADAQARCVLFRSKAQLAGVALRDGLSVEVRAVPSIFEPRGEFQLNVETVRLAGVGALYEKFERLKARLAAEGWFAEARKRPLPEFPRAIGVVTSPRAAALRDVVTTLARRWPALSVVVYPAAVQGTGAASEIARAIAAANAHARVDVLIVARGGGSIEDLWAFNEEIVARAVFESAIPIVSGVGHETDFTICDFVADVRAPTPTGAATLATPDGRAVSGALAALSTRFRRAGMRALETRIQRTDNLARRLIHPAARLAQQRRDMVNLAARLARAWRSELNAARQRIDGGRGRVLWLIRRQLPQRVRVASLGDGLRRGAAARVERSRARVATLEQNLAHLNPREVLARGYAIVAKSDGSIVDDAARLSIGDAVALAFARGSAEATITRPKVGSETTFVEPQRESGPRAKNA
ncbi:MAG TPA: exodeoxyribonuclease VII large subunit [Casimicrobiaceae bacterium]|nr:exodeoxyribonuclease VII large subunit [Casimicrobiaceae bacterium]